MAIQSHHLHLFGYKASRHPSMETSLPPTTPLPTAPPSLPFSHLPHSIIPFTNLHDSVGKSSPPHPFFTSLIIPSSSRHFSLNFRNDSNFAQPLWRWSVHNTFARKSQDPQSHRIHSGTITLLRLHDNARGNAIDVKLGNVIQQRSPLE